MKEPSDSAAAGLENLISMIKSLKSPETIAKVKTFLKALPAAAGSALRSEGLDEQDLDEKGGGYMREPSDSASAGLENLISMIKSLKSPETIAKVKEFLKGLPAGASAAMRSEEVEQDLQEALQAVKILRNQLQEVNLLNAKLLYVNKVFKSTNLSEGQKVNVIAAFDKAETVKEVKLVFETVSKNVVAKPAALKEHRSFASKATGNATTTAPKEILSEVSEQVQRWQKLAGIIKS
jgi:vacuolar-type H+-ATPase subunit I/STV1